MRKIFLILMLSGLLGADFAFAQFAPVGTSGAQFLEIGLGARPVGMGEAFTAVTDDALSVYWNPSGLVKIKGIDISLSYMNWPADISYQSGVFGINLGDIGAFGVSVAELTTGSEPVRTELQPEGTSENWSFSDLVAGISFAKYVTDKLAVGINLKYVLESYWDYSAGAWAIDFGTQYDIGLKDLTLAMCIENFGPETQFGGTYTDYDAGNKEKEFMKYSLPMRFRVGLATTAIRTETYSLTVAVDAIHPNDNMEHYNVGMELWLSDMLAIRAGYKFNYDEEGLTAGMGFALPMVAKGAEFDYAFDNMGRLGMVHRVSFGLEF
jgi:hypothetical protein